MPVGDATGLTGLGAAAARVSSAVLDMDSSVESWQVHWGKRGGRFRLESRRISAYSIVIRGRDGREDIN